MIGWLIRGLLFMAGIITGMLISKDDNHFEVVQMMVAIGLFTLLAAVLAFMPVAKQWRKRKDSQKD